MSALTRTTSVHGGNNSQVLFPMSNGHGSDHGSLANVRNVANIASPLQIFVRAKKRINDIFADIQGYTEETLHFLKELPEEEEIVTEECKTTVCKHELKVRAIRDVLSRDHMKCVFFGRTSNGKSSVINAMLREKILPSGIGHTTNCFLQVEGSENGESYLITEDSSEKQNVKSVAQLAHALCTEKMGDSALMRVIWPKDKCPLLRDDVVFVDSPGIDVSPNLDEWIDKHCLDADVFVLVANAESTLMLTEKNFFFKVSSKLSKPNIFILNNRWDASASEPEYLHEVRKQHLQRAVDFLVEELKVYSNRQEAERRVFFISAKEVLTARLNEHKGLPLNQGISTLDGFTNRLFEFEDFEKQFEECISRSAVRTKFDQHTSRGKVIINDVRGIMDKVHETSVSKYEQKSKEQVQLVQAIEETERQMLLITKEAKQRICNMVEEVETKVSKAISEEIRRLSILVEEFSEPFDSNPLVLNEFKKKLHKHVDYGLVSNLRSRLTSAVAMNMEAAQKDMAARVVNILPESKRDKVQMPAELRTFEVQYPFRCDNLCSDFKEDIEFKFSFGVLTFVNKVVGGKHGLLNRLKRSPNDQIPRPLALSPQTPVIQTASLIGNEDWSMISKFAMATVSSQGAMGGLLVGGFLMKTVGWRLIAATGVFYGAMYVYERLMWTNKAKERAFKRQYVDHVTRQLRLVVDLVSSNCSHQVQQELSGTFARLGSYVDTAAVDMQSQLRVVTRSIQTYDSVSSDAKKLRNKATYILNELDRFEESFLKAV